MTLGCTLLRPENRSVPHPAFTNYSSTWPTRTLTAWTKVLNFSSKIETRQQTYLPNQTACKTEKITKRFYLKKRFCNSLIQTYAYNFKSLRKLCNQCWINRVMKCSHVKQKKDFFFEKNMITRKVRIQWFSTSASLGPLSIWWASSNNYFFW